MNVLTVIHNVFKINKKVITTTSVDVSEEPLL